MPTRAEIRADIELRISAGKPSDDLELSDLQINFWIDSARNKIIVDSVKQKVSQIEDIIASSATLITGNPIKIQSETISVSNSKFQNPSYFVTIGTVLSLPNDMGITQVFNLNGDPVNKVRITDLPALKAIRTIKPTDCNPVCYRVQDKLMIIGPSTDFLKNGYLMVYGVLADTSEIADDAEYPFPADMTLMLIELAEQIGRRQLQAPQDLTQDGVQ